MRNRPRTDANQSRIVSALRQCGVRVLILSQLGHGVPDLLCAPKHGPMLLLEIKDGTKPPSAQKLTPDEAEWHDLWHDRVRVVNSVEQALEAMQINCCNRKSHWAGSLISALAVTSWLFGG